MFPRGSPKQNRNSMKSSPLNALSNAMNDNSNNDNSGDDKDSKGASTALSSFKLLLLTMMVLQNSSTVLVGRYTRAGVPEADLYDVNHLITIIYF